MSVLRATDTKSCVDIRLSRGGFESGEKDVVAEGGGLAQVSVMDELSSVPTCFEESRELLMRDGAWISLYAVEASRPA